MLTMSGAVSSAPDFLACDDSGSARRSAGCCLNVVVTIRKISITMRISISATMMTVGAPRRLRMKKRMLLGDQFPVLPANEFVTQRFHLHGEGLNLLRVIAPRNQGRNGNQQADKGGTEDERNSLGQLGRVGKAGLAHVAKRGHHPQDRSHET